MKVHRSVTEPLSKIGAPWQEKWESDDKGLVTAWEVGRQEAVQNPKVALQALDGQLIVLPWKGGVSKALKLKQKYGTLLYLAMWQGLRGEDLDIDTDKELTMTCSATQMNVVFTADSGKYAEP
jgi:hypothetical protein